jgi:hypothetical protein
MGYLIQFELYIDGEDEVFSEEDIENFLKDYLDSAAITAKNIKLLKVIG